MGTNSNFFYGLMVVVFLALPGCAPPSFWRYGPDRQPLEEFEKRVENVFRLQNNMTSEIMAIQDFEGTGESQAVLSSAEQAMQKACADLNDYAAREIDGRTQGLLLRHRVESSVEACEAAAHHVKQLLKSQH